MVVCLSVHSIISNYRPLVLIRKHEAQARWPRCQFSYSLHIPSRSEWARENDRHNVPHGDPQIEEPGLSEATFIDVTKIEVSVVM